MCRIPHKTTTKTNQKTVAHSTRSVEEMLREIAYVLRMTKQVKESILADRVEIANERSNSNPELTIVSA